MPAFRVRIMRAWKAAGREKTLPRAQKNKRKRHRGRFLGQRRKSESSIIRACAHMHTRGKMLSSYAPGCARSARHADARKRTDAQTRRRKRRHAQRRGTSDHAQAHTRARSCARTHTQPRARERLLNSFS